jgi:prepilin-type N-terminal cleavage/methylation domain-containing protein
MRSKNGFTLLELLLVVGITGLVLAALTTLLTASARSYTSEHRLLEMRRTSENLLTELSDLLYQAGVDLPKDEQIITVAGSRDVTVLINRRSAYMMFKVSQTPTYKCAVTDAAPFVGAQQLRKRENSSPPVFVDCYLNASMNQGSFVAGVDTTHDSLCLTTQEDFYTGDELYSYTRNHILYDSAGSRLFLVKQPLGGTADSSVEAEQVKDFGAYFYKGDGQTATCWADMKQCSLMVSMGSTRPDRLRPNAHQLTIGKKFVLRNRLL